ncbi:hypothetical protein B0H17DRAFT_1135545 [Mycena rosella]|uniref:CCHC-type domain-containing protein n=1 Tax=Mycena rosella TaxID=1033263 RepID=A0AAD7DFW3_MYCRO|nr:hypothetical protein B0H17DRAFT_1135545 [Mycena rosella]
MTDTTIKLFKGDGVRENATDFLNAIRRRILLSAACTDDQKIEYFELSLKDGSYASNWFAKLKVADKKTFKDLAAAFRTQWPAKEMAEKSKGEVQEELLGLVLTLGEGGVRVEEDGIYEYLLAVLKSWTHLKIRIKGHKYEVLPGSATASPPSQEWGHVRWALKVAELGARVDPGGGLIAQVVKNIPDALLLRVDSKSRETWSGLVQAMKDIPPSDLASIRRQEERIDAMQQQLNTANATIAGMQQTPTRGLATAFSGMAASSLERNRPDPVRRTLFPPANAAAKPAQRYRPDHERLQIIKAAPVTIHPRTPAGQAAYTQQMTAYTQAHGAGKPSEDRPYRLSRGTVAMGSGECHQCGQIGHFFDKCTVAAERRVPEAELRWRQVVQSIISRIGRAQREATAVNVVADAVEEEDGDVFGAYPSAEYDQSVIAEFLAQQGKGRGLSA